MRLKYEVPNNRVASFDQAGNRVYLFPSKVAGWFRTRKTIIEILLFAIFVLLPLIPIRGKPAVFLDIAHREFFLFGLKFWATDTPFLFFILGIFFFSLMFATAVWGRVWCGWVCPQTVLVGFLYQRIETWVEGDSRQRRLLHESPLNFLKFKKRATKWLLFGVMSLLIAHVFLAYFVSWKGWAECYSSGFQGSHGTLIVLIILTFLSLLNFGWFREQFCIVACPYGRWQTVWMDNRSMVVDYASWRGEPRRGRAPMGEPQGDCVNCYRCVQACPTGVDIRRGVQLECIACTACMDACDDVMTSLGKKPGLIRYTSFLQLREPGFLEKRFRIVWRLRSLLYLAVVAALTILFMVSLTLRNPIWIAINRLPGPLFLTENLPSGEVATINTMKITVRNQLAESIHMSVSPEGIEGLLLLGDTNNMVLSSGEQNQFIIIAQKKSFANEGVGGSKNFKLKFQVRGDESGKVYDVAHNFRFMSR